MSTGHEDVLRSLFEAADHLLQNSYPRNVVIAGTRGKKISVIPFHDRVLLNVNMRDKTYVVCVDTELERCPEVLYYKMELWTTKGIGDGSLYKEFDQSDKAFFAPREQRYRTNANRRPPRARLRNPSLFYHDCSGAIEWTFTLNGPAIRHPRAYGLFHVLRASLFVNGRNKSDQVASFGMAFKRRGFSEIEKGAKPVYTIALWGGEEAVVQLGVEEVVVNSQQFHQSPPIQFEKQTRIRSVAPVSKPVTPRKPKKPKRSVNSGSGGKKVPTLQPVRTRSMSRPRPVALQAPIPPPPQLPLPVQVPPPPALAAAAASVTVRNIAPEIEVSKPSAVPSASAAGSAPHAVTGVKRPRDSPGEDDPDEPPAKRKKAV